MRSAQSNAHWLNSAAPARAGAASQSGKVLLRPAGLLASAAQRQLCRAGKVTPARLCGAGLTGIPIAPAESLRDRDAGHDAQAEWVRHCQVESCRGTERHEVFREVVRTFGASREFDRCSAL